MTNRFVTPLAFSRALASRSLALCALLACGTAARADESVQTTQAAAAVASAVPAASMQTLAEIAADRAKAIVTIKFIAKGDGEDQEVEVPGTLISGDGLVLTSNFFFQGSSPSEIKVLVGDDTQGVDATFVARDTELGLAWIRTDAKPETAYSFVDFAKGTTAVMGDEVIAVRKMGKFFGQTPVINEAKIAAVTAKPRTLLIPTNGLSMRGDIAVAIYTKAGALVGLTSFIMPEEDEMGGSGNPMRGADNGMILTAKDVAEATTKAIESAASETAKPADGEKTADKAPATETPAEGTPAPKPE
jgi:hypothetical protein